MPKTIKRKKSSSRVSIKRYKNVRSVSLKLINPTKLNILPINHSPRTLDSHKKLLLTAFRN